LGTTSSASSISAASSRHCRRRFRIDPRLGANNRIYLIEANPNPWLDPIAEFAMAANESGLSYTEMIDRIVQAALERKK
jgi:D-alanine-D-alanine ligase-like ATP-grasp enzyme